MNLTKVTYSAGDTITADNLNAIQDNIVKYCVPNYSTSNNGQFLRILNGQLVWDAIEMAEDIEF